MDFSEGQKSTSFIFSAAAPVAEQKKFFGLGAKFTVLIVTGLAFITIITTTISVRHLRNALNLGSREMAETMGRIVGITAAYQGFFALDNRLLTQYVDFAASQPDVVYTAIFPFDGDVIQRGLTASELSAIQKGETPYPPEDVLQEKQDIVMEPPIGKIGTIVLGISKKRIKEEEKKVITIQVATAGGIVVVSLLVLWIVIHSITRPLRQLTEYTRLIGQGVLNKPLKKVSGRDEVAQLSASIEEMRSNLHVNVETIAFLNKISHELNYVMSLDEAIAVIRKGIKAFPFWPWHEVGLALLGRGGENFPKTQFNYHRILPPPALKDGKSVAYPLRDSLMSEIVYEKKMIARMIAWHSGSRGHPFSLYLNDREIKSHIIIPLVIKMKVLGVLYAGFRDNSSQSSEIQNITQNIADELATTIEGMYLLYDLRSSLRELGKAHQELKMAHQELKGLDDLKSEFISSVSHELRTPLVSMTGYLHMMIEEKLGKITDLQREGLEVSIKSLQRLTTLIEKMLLFSRKQKAMKLEISDFEIRKVVEHCMATLGPVAAQRNVKLISSVEEGLPCVRADEDKIIQVIINLVDNAIKFGKVERGKVEIIARRPSAPQDSGKIEVLVRDNGKGIAEEHLPHIFEKLWQPPKEAGYSRKGIGLGLALVKKIVNRHGCKLIVESKLGVGSTFLFTLPVASEGEGPEEEDREEWTGDM